MVAGGTPTCAQAVNVMLRKQVTSLKLCKQIETKVRNSQRRMTIDFQPCKVGLLCTAPGSDVRRLQLSGELLAKLSLGGPIRCFSPSAFRSFFANIERKFMHVLLWFLVALTMTVTCLLMNNKTLCCVRLA